MACKLTEKVVAQGTRRQEGNGRKQEKKKNGFPSHGMFSRRRFVPSDFLKVRRTQETAKTSARPHAAPNRRPPQTRTRFKSRKHKTGACVRRWANSVVALDVRNQRPHDEIMSLKYCVPINWKMAKEVMNRRSGILKKMSARRTNILGAHSTGRDPLSAPRKTAACTARAENFFFAGWGNGSGIGRNFIKGPFLFGHFNVGTAQCNGFCRRGGAGHGLIPCNSPHRKILYYFVDMI